MADEKPAGKVIKYKDGTEKFVPVVAPPVKPYNQAPAGELERAKLLSSDARTKAANMRRSHFTTLLAQGYRPDQAAKEVGIAMHTYYQWRNSLPAFRGQCDLARQNWYNTISGSDITKWDEFSAFRKRFFRMDTYYPHAMMIDAIETAGPMDVTLILVAPETGKTTLLEDKICEILARDPDRRVAYISESSGHSVKVGSRIRRRMTDRVDFGDYISQFGPFYEDNQERNGKPWSTHYFTVFKAGHDERDYSFEARGGTSSIQGSRVDDLFLDDIQSIKSLNNTALLIQKMRQEWITRVGRIGRIFIIGNRVGNGDFYEKLIELGLIDRLVEIPILNSSGHSTIPELWPDEDLAKRKIQVGDEVWARTYMQDPQAASSVTFPPAVREKFKDYGRKVEKLPGLPVVMSLDPAIGGGCSITVGQYNQKYLYVVDQETRYGLGRTEEILTFCEQYIRTYRPDDFIIEMMAFQQALGKDDRMLALQSKYGFRIYPHTTGDNKFDPNFGVASMATSIRSQEMTIPWGDTEAEAKFEPLLHELERWRPHVRGVKLRMDAIMSLWFMHLFWMSQRNVLDFETKKNSFKRGGLPWKPTSLRKVRG